MSETENKNVGLTLTFGQIANQNFENALNQLSQSSNMPGSTSFRIARLIAKLAPELKVFNERRIETFKKHGSPDAENPDNIRVPPENMEAFNKDFTPILEEVALEMPSWKRLTANDFGEAGLTMSPLMFLAISPLMVDED